MPPSQPAIYRMTFWVFNLQIGVRRFEFLHSAADAALDVFQRDLVIRKVDNDSPSFIWIRISPAFW
jgi:hypothetical protein